MKILHLCLSCRYVDNYSYQENLLPRKHALEGNQVFIVASTETYIDNKYVGYIEAKSYLTESGIPITRLPYKKILTKFLTIKLRLYKGLYKQLTNIKPDMIFIHGHHFVSIYEIKKYAVKFPNTTIFVDSHCDYFNTAKTWLSKNVLHKIIYKLCAKIIEPYVTKFYGTLPERCDFLHDIYNIPKNLIEYLPLGFDEAVVDLSKKDLIRKKMRENLSFKDEDFIVVTGGRIEKRKKITELMSLLKDFANINLVIFGSLTDEIKREFESLLIYTNIKYVGWIEPEKVYDYFMMADAVVFPGSHSVLWEQAEACDVPCYFDVLTFMNMIDAFHKKQI